MTGETDRGLYPPTFGCAPLPSTSPARSRLPALCRVRPSGRLRGAGVGANRWAGGHAPLAQSTPSQGTNPVFDEFGCYRFPSWFDKGAWSSAEWQIYWGVPAAIVEHLVVQNPLF